MTTETQEEILSRYVDKRRTRLEDIRNKRYMIEGRYFRNELTRREMEELLHGSTYDLLREVERLETKISLFPVMYGADPRNATLKEYGTDGMEYVCEWLQRAAYERTVCDGTNNRHSRDMDFVIDRHLADPVIKRLAQYRSYFPPLKRMLAREMKEDEYTALLNKFRVNSEEPSNPVEDRPTIIYPDAQQYKADMRKLAKGLEKRLGAV